MSKQIKGFQVEQITELEFIVVKDNNGQMVEIKYPDLKSGVINEHFCWFCEFDNKLLIIPICKVSSIERMNG